MDELKVGDLVKTVNPNLESADRKYTATYTNVTFAATIKREWGQSNETFEGIAIRVLGGNLGKEWTQTCNYWLRVTPDHIVIVSRRDPSTQKDLTYFIPARDVKVGDKMWCEKKPKPHWVPVILVRKEILPTGKTVLVTEQGTILISGIWVLAYCTKAPTFTPKKIC